MYNRGVEAVSKVTEVPLAWCAWLPNPQRSHGT